MKRGIYLIIGAAVLSGCSNFFNKLAMQAVKMDPYQYTTLKNVVAAVLLSLLFVTPFIWKKLAVLRRNDWLALVLVSLIGGSIPFLLYFKGLSMTSAVTASFIHKTMFIWIAILAWPLLKEKISRFQLGALAVLCVGNFVFEGFTAFHFGYAEMLITAATILWAIESIIVKKILPSIEPLVVGWARMFIGSVWLVVFLAVTHNIQGLLSVAPHQLPWIALVSVFLAGYVALWFSALKRLPVTVTACYLVLASPITTFLNALFVTHTISAQKIIGLAIIGIALVALSSLKTYKQYDIAGAKI